MTVKSCVVEFLLLGSLIVTLDGRLVSLGRRRERLLLAVLLLDVGMPVETGRLIELLWDADEQPRDPRAAVHVYVSRLRQALERLSSAERGVRLGSSGSAYVLHADPQSVDAHRFASLVQDARGLDDPAARTARHARPRADPASRHAPDPRAHGGPADGGPAPVRPTG